mmetsp:Transcript_27629/g.60043  ORF Transcript_27629/g.60043 Transcript_27629/m.60043 type:complete len:770 (-) Transcript_27629:79-2388(-)
MVASDTTVLRGSSFGGSRAQKPKLFRGGKTNSNSNSSSRNSRRSSSSNKRWSATDAAAAAVDAEECDPAGANAAVAVRSKSAPRSTTGGRILTTGPSTGDTSSGSGTDACSSSLPAAGLPTASSIYRSPRAPSFGRRRRSVGAAGAAASKKKNNGLSTSNSAASSPKYFDAGEYEYEVSMLADDDDYREGNSISSNKTMNSVLDGAASIGPTSPCLPDDANILSVRSHDSAHVRSAAAASAAIAAAGASAAVSAATSTAASSTARARAKSPLPSAYSSALTKSQSLGVLHSNDDVDANIRVSCSNSDEEGTGTTAATMGHSASSSGGPTLVVTGRPIPTSPVRKTIYLIRHAESDENRRQQSLYKSIGSVRKLVMPNRADLTASLELVDMNAQIDSDVSRVGRRQIAHVGRKLREDDFVANVGIELVVHSPLRRARQTSAGMLGCVAPKVAVVVGEQRRSSDAGGSSDAFGQFISLKTPSTSFDVGPSTSSDGNDESNALPGSPSVGSNGGLQRNTSLGDGLKSLLNPMPPDPTAGGEQAPSVSRTVELPSLAERTPLEWLPINHDQFTNRIASFEKWLAEQPESVIAVVGHSHYFMCMLGLDYKFRNCDVWRVTYDSSVGLWISPEEVKREVRKDYWRQKEDKRREKSAKMKRDLEEKKEKMRRDIEERKDRVKKDWERLLRQMKIDGFEDSDADGSDDKDKTAETTTTGTESRGNEKKSMQDMGTVEEEHLPRGWSGLTRLYTYEPDLLVDNESMRGNSSEDNDKVV